MLTWKGLFLILALALGFTLSTTLPCRGTSLAPEIVEKLKAEGKLGEYVEAIKDARARGVNQPSYPAYRLGVTTAQSDTMRAIVILVDFDDMQKEWVYDSEPWEFDTLLFSFGSHPTGSMRDFYWENSYDQFVVTGTVAGWYRMPELYSYYVDGQRGFGSYPHNAQKLAEDAVYAADPDVDYSEFDNNGDGMVEALFVIHAGPGYEDTGNPNYIHSHAWTLRSPVNLDGVALYRYSMEPEEMASGELVRIGVFCHEFGHVLGLPDLYDTDYSSDGLGAWSLMASGSWGGGGKTPCHFDGWCKTALGFAIAERPDANLTNVLFEAVEVDPTIYRLWTFGGGTYEYFLVENRRQILFDESLPGEGILVFHVDERMPDNRNEEHYKVALEQADGNFQLERGMGSDPGDPYPGTSDNRTFDDFSWPNAYNYFGEPTQVAVWNISDSDSLMYADLDVVYTRPYLVLNDYSFDDSPPDGNGDGRPEAGETVDFLVTIGNKRADANDVTVTAGCDDPEIVFVDSISYIGFIPWEGTGNNSGDPIIFSVPEGFETRSVSFLLTVEANGGEYRTEAEVEFMVGHPYVLVVDDDDGDNLESYYLEALGALEEAGDVWDKSSQGSVGDNLLNYQVVIWFTGDHRDETLTPDDVDDLTTYLDNGGSLFLTGQDIAEHLSQRGNPEDLAFLEQKLHISYDGLATDHLLEGVQGDTIGDGLDLVTAGLGGAANQVSQDALISDGASEACFMYTPSQVAGIHYSNDPGTFKVVFFGFGFEGINDSLQAQGYAQRIDVFRRVMSWLYVPIGVEEGEILSGIPRQFQLEQNYPNPFNSATTISYHLPKASQVKLEIYNLLGQKVATLVDGKQQAGYESVNWRTSEVSSGIYYYRLTAGDFTQKRRMTLLK